MISRTACTFSRAKFASNTTVKSEATFSFQSFSICAMIPKKASPVTAKAGWITVGFMARGVHNLGVVENRLGHYLGQIARQDAARRGPELRTLRTGRARSQACLPGHGRKIGNEKRPARNQPRFEAEWRWVCRMPSVTERLVVSSPSVCEVWAHRLLRQFSEPACVQACGDNRAFNHCQLRAG
jgi:hypothetical protein